MERVLVTGAGGYIGTTLVPMPLAEGYEVRALNRLFFGRHLLPTSSWRSSGRQPAPRVDYVIDLVAISNDPSGELFWEATYHQAFLKERVRVIDLVGDPRQAQLVGLEPQG